MKAKELEKTSKPLEDIYRDIELANQHHDFKVFYINTI